jgi:hypothetical protein
VPGPDDRVFAAGFVELASGLAAAEQLFGEEAVLQLVRVMGSAMSPVADALLSAFLVNVEPAARGEDPVGLAVAHANAEAVSLLPFVGSALDTLLRQHLLPARRTILGDAVDTGYKTPAPRGRVRRPRRLHRPRAAPVDARAGCRAHRVENEAADAVTAAGGRVRARLQRRARGRSNPHPCCVMRPAQSTRRVQAGDTRPAMFSGAWGPFADGWAV